MASVCSIISNRHVWHLSPEFRILLEFIGTPSVPQLWPVDCPDFGHIVSPNRNKIVFLFALTIKRDFLSLFAAAKNLATAWMFLPESLGGGRGDAAPHPPGPYAYDIQRGYIRLVGAPPTGSAFSAITPINITSLTLPTRQSRLSDRRIEVDDSRSEHNYLFSDSGDPIFQTHIKTP